jgi:outer membrane protein TolC
MLLWIIPTVQADELTLPEAVMIAGKKDPILEQSIAKAKALEEQAIADDQWVDPKVKFALQSFPTNDLNYTREGMTQIVAGISQSLPRGETLKYKSQKTLSMSSVERAKFEEQKRQITLTVRQNWLDLYYWYQAKKTIDESEALLKEVIEATESAYGTGRQNTQDIIRAELELSVLQDRRIDVLRKIKTGQAELGKWVGLAVAERSLPLNFPKMPKIKNMADIKETLQDHPKIKIADAMVLATKNDISMAKEQYKPGFNLGLNYGLRNGTLANGDDRPDFITAMVTMDVPLFTKKRQDKKLSARKHDKAAANFMRQDVLRILNTNLQGEYKNWEGLRARAEHYKTDVIKRAEENFEAALRAYQEDLTDFSSLMRAQIMELDTKLQTKKLQIDAAKSQARLLYLQGEI